jgi:hypothetical protein
MKGVFGAIGVTECEGEEGEVGGENPVNGRTSRPDSLDILRMSGVPRQLETFDVQLSVNVTWDAMSRREGACRLHIYTNNAHQVLHNW